MVRAAFLFGSGISLASHGPSVEAITRLILDESPVRKPDPIREFLRLVKGEINDHLQEKDGREANYEDLFAAVDQIFQDLTGNIISPLITRPLNLLREASLDLQRSAPSTGWSDPFASLCSLSIDLIQTTVWGALQSIGEPKGLDVIADVANATEGLDIFTLNHDLQVERILLREGIGYSDGFNETDGEVTRFSWSWKPEDRVRLFKLHGSINWFRYQFEAPDFSYRQYARVLGDYRYCKLANGKVANHVGDLPAILTGTTVKEQAYGTYLFGDVFRYFRKYLSNHDSIICCGYGWGDKGINHRLRQWLDDGLDHRLIILHNGPADQIASTRFWGFKWDEYNSRNKVMVFPKWLSECSLQDLQPFFDER